MEIAARTDAAVRREELADQGWTQLPGFLQAHGAESLHTTLAQVVDWRFVLNHQGRHHDIHPLQVAAIDASARQAIAAGVAAGAQRGFQYAYDNYPVGDIAADGGKLPAQIAGVHDLIVGGPFVAFARDLTGDARIASADLQATRYRPGHFLTTHDDSLEGKHRLYAYVLGLTKSWRPEFGGLLLFHDGAGHIQHGLTPGFNVLNIFRVPHPHSVSQVATFAPAFRYSVTGWLKSAA
ncbi:MAG: 2OG-Fe(II) oxygenase family protein [Gammaproteobacteria bacterium]